MKNFFKLLTLSILLTTIGCKNRTFITEIKPEPSGFIEGSYFGAFGAEIELLTNDRGQVKIKHKQNLISINPQNDTYAVHPKTNTGYLFAQNGVLTVRKNVNYTNNYDIENDLTGANISGKRLTVFTYSLDQNDELTVKVEIFSDELKDNPNFIHATRTFKLN